MTFNSGASSVDRLATTDGIGRPIERQVRQAPGSTNFDSISYKYGLTNNVGGFVKQSMPFQGSASSSGGSIFTVTQYDALGRPQTVTDGGTGVVTRTYSGRDVLVAVGPTPVTQRQLEYDGLGRLASVCEMTSGTTLWPGGTCNQNVPRTGYWTQYTYDALGNIVSVTQNSQSASSEPRTYSHDGLGRMTSESNPETGTVLYYYDSDPNGICAGSYSGDLVRMYDAVHNNTCYTYDSMRRVTSITYPSGPYSANTAAKHFVYDAATLNGTAMTYGVGRLVEAYTGPSTSKITDLFFSYSKRGERQVAYQSTPNSGGYFQISASYWAHGGLQTLSGIPGTPTISYSLDGEGRISGAAASSGPNPVTGVTYTTTGTAQPIGSLTQVVYGSTGASGDSDNFGFDVTTGRMISYQVNMGSPAKSDTGTLTWNANGTLNKLVINDQITSSTDSETCNYSYDDLNRATSANCGSTIWNQTFSFDPFGNIIKSAVTGTSFNPTYTSNPPTNQYLSVPSCTPAPAYDANGSPTWDCLHSYQWNSAGNPQTIDSVGFVYDALGRMVQTTNGSAFTEVVYAPNGEKIALMNGLTTLQKSMISLPGGGTAIYKGTTGLSHYRHGDWLGSARLSTTPGQTLYYDVAYGPYGESYAGVVGSGGNTSVSFTGIGKDTPTDLYPFMYREYNSNQSRWVWPDPAGLAAANPVNPQSWNRYAYVLSNPLGLVDPLGFCPNGVPGPCVQETPPPGWDPFVFHAYSCANCFSISAGDTDGGEGAGIVSAGRAIGQITALRARIKQFKLRAKKFARTVGSYIPTPCGGGLFNYYGGAAGVPDATVAVARWQQADTRSGYSEGIFAELNSGEALTVGVGQQGPLGGEQEHYFFFGAGGNAMIFSGNASGFVSDSNSVGFALEGSLGRWSGGVGVYSNVDSMTSCLDHAGK